MRSPGISRRTLLGTAATVGAAFATRPIATAAVPRGSARGGAPRVLQPTAVDHFDPLTNAGGHYPSALIYAQLFKWARPPVGRPGALLAEPYLAESAELLDDGTVIVRLRANARFHDVAPVDGRLVTADDVVATWERFTDVPGAGDDPTAAKAGPVMVPTALDERTVKFTLRRPYAPLFSGFADVGRSILAREAIERGPEWLKHHPVGSGPFQLASYKPGVEVVLKPTSLPWWSPWVRDRPAPYFDGIVFVVIPDDSAKQTAALLGGTLDYGIVAQTDWKTVESDSRFDSTKFASHSFSYLRINQGLKPMDDVRVRQALSVGINRGRIARKSFAGGARRTGPIPVSLDPWGVPVRDLPLNRYNPRMARQLLAAAGFEDGLTVKNLYPAMDNFHTDLAKAVTISLLDVGVTVEQDSLPLDRYLAKARLARTDPEGAGWGINVHVGNRYNDIDGYLREYETFGEWNYGHWGDVDTDRLISAARGEYDVALRAGMVQEIQHTIAEQAWTPGLLLPIRMEAWNAQLTHMAVGPEPVQGTRSFIDASFRASDAGLV